MYIKNIFNIKNFKGLEDNQIINFDDITYIIGDNAKNKTTTRLFTTLDFDWI